MIKNIHRITVLALLLRILALAVSGTTGLYAQGTWARIDVPTDRYLRSVHFTDSLYGWAVGDSGTIIHTTDGGNSWAHQESQSVNQLVNVFFLNRNLGWVSAFNFTSPPYGTELLKTTNGGEDWASEPYPVENIFMNCILFLDSLNGWMGGSPHALVRTTDGGNSWEQAEIDTNNLAFFPVLSIRFYDENYGYACGGMFDIAGVTWSTSDGGEKWYPIDASDAPADEVHELHLYDSVTVMGAGGDPDFGYGVAMIRTVDGGVNWDYEELGIPGNAFDLDFRNDDEAWAPLGPRQKFIYSLDAGTTWTQVLTPDATSIFDVIFPDSLHGFAVGEEGAMLKYTPPDPVSIKPVSIVPEGEFMLHQNHPNPFTRSTSIAFTIPPSASSEALPSSQESIPVQLRIYDVLGNEVAVPVNEDLLPGVHQVVFDAAGLPAGIYFCQLTVTVPGNAGRATGPGKTGAARVPVTARVSKKMILRK